MESHELVIQLDPRAGEMRRVHEALDCFGRKHDLSSKHLSSLHLAIEEHLANIISYAYKALESTPIRVTLQMGSREVIVLIEDQGRPFNPLQYPVPDTSGSLDEKPIGGLGIHMMRNSVDRIDYERRQGRNRVTLVKKTDA